MASRTVIDGNAFYEIDEECMRHRENERRRMEQQRRTQYAQRAEAAEKRICRNRSRI